MSEKSVEFVNMQGGSEVEKFLAAAREAGFVCEYDSDAAVVTLKKYQGDAEDVQIPRPADGCAVRIDPDCFDCRLGKMKTLALYGSVEPGDWCLRIPKFLSTSIHVLEPTEKLYDVDGALFVVVDGKCAVIFPDRHPAEHFAIPEGIEHLRVIYVRSALKSLSLPASLRSVNSNLLEIPAELFFASDVELTRPISNGYGLDLSFLFTKRPIHVPEDAETIIRVATRKKLPLVIEPGDGKAKPGADDPKRTKFVVKHLEGGELEIVGVMGATENLVVPAQIGGRSVTRLGREAFAGNWQSIALPEGLKVIGSSAFERCKVDELVIPKSVERIESRAFDRADVDEIRFAGETCEFEEWALSESPLKRVTLPARMNQVLDRMFLRCKSLESVCIPDCVERIGYNAFYGCAQLREVTLPQGLRELGSDAFSESGLVHLRIPSGVKRIPVRLCSCCRKLEEVEFAAGTEEVWGCAFEECEKLSRVSGLEQVRQIGEKAFFYCTALTKIHIESEPIIGRKAFQGTKWLEEPDEEFKILGSTLLRCNATGESVVIPAQVKRIGELAFCKPMSTWFERDSLYVGMSNLRRVTIGEQVEFIGREAFRDCKKLEEVIIENPRIHIDRHAFSDTPALREVEGSCILLNDMLVAYTGLNEEFAVPPDVRRILPCAFNARVAKRLRRVIVGEGVRRIDDEAFHDCNLHEVVIPAAVTEISEDAFNLLRWHSSEESDDGSGQKQIVTAQMFGIERFMCTENSPIIPIAQMCKREVEIVSDEEIAEITRRAREGFQDASREWVLRFGTVIRRHPILTQLDREFSAGDAVERFERFVERDGSPMMIENLLQALMPALHARGVASERWGSNWSAVATTAVFLSQYAYLTDVWYHIPSDFMPDSVSSKHPVLACYNYMRRNYCKSGKIRRKLSEACVYNVQEVNKHVLKQAWQSPYNYIDCLYQECARASEDRERIAYNRLIGVLGCLAELR